MKKLPLQPRLLRYLATTAALGGASAPAAIVYQSFETTLQDPSTSETNLDNTLAAIRFDGASVTLTHTAAGGAVSLSADEFYLSSGTAKTDEGGRLAGSGYLQTASILNAGELIATGFTAASGEVLFTGSASDQYIGVSTPAGQLGWIRFSYAGDGTTVTVHDAAFQTDAGVAIAAGSVVPEPSALGLAGLAGGLAALRRRRKAA